MRLPRPISSLVLAWLTLTQPAIAGMPSIRFSDVASMRLEVISFFLMGLLLSAVAVQLIWNVLRRDFRRMPRLTFGKSLGLVVLWGLLFTIVLTMISGARELMTPGAWEKDGLTYKLRNGTLKLPSSQTSQVGVSPVVSTIDSRRLRLAALGELLREYERTHGKYPENATDVGTEKSWELPDPSGIQYIYLPGRRNVEPGVPLAYEPTVFDERSLVLMADGEIRQLSVEEIRLLAEKER